MAALTADKKREVSGTPLGIKIPVAGSTTIYKGALVVLDAGGDAVPATDASGLPFMGVAAETVDNSGGSDGDKTIVVERGHVELLNHSALVAADRGKNVVVSDDNTVTDANAATNDLKVGTLIDLPASGKARVLIGVFADVNA